MEIEQFGEKKSGYLKTKNIQNLLEENQNGEKEPTAQQSFPAVGPRKIVCMLSKTDFNSSIPSLII